MTKGKISPNATVTVVPVTTPVKHGTLLHAIGEPFEAAWHEVQELIEAGIARLEGKSVAPQDAGKKTTKAAAK